MRVWLSKERFYIVSQLRQSKRFLNLKRLHKFINISGSWKSQSVLSIIWKFLERIKCCAFKM